MMTLQNGCWDTLDFGRLVTKVEIKQHKTAQE